jgi:hypothetical protein
MGDEDLGKNDIICIPVAAFGFIFDLKFEPLPGVTKNAECRDAECAAELI